MIEGINGTRGSFEEEQLITTNLSAREEVLSVEPPSFSAREITAVATALHKTHNTVVSITHCSETTSTTHTFRVVVELRLTGGFALPALPALPASPEEEEEEAPLGTRSPWKKAYRWGRQWNG